MKAGITTDHLSTAQVTNPALIGRAAEWHAAGLRLALAFVMQSWGSSPRPVGSVMLVREDMAVEGSVSGGCVEGAVIEAAMTALQDGTGQRLDFGVADETAWEVGLSCGGENRRASDAGCRSGIAGSIVARHGGRYCGTQAGICAF